MWPFRQKRTPPHADVPAPGGQPFRVLSLLTPEETQALGGIPPQAIIGMFPGAVGDMSVASFRPSPVFAAFLDETIRAWGPDDPELRAAARAQGDGWIYIIDLRTPEGPQGRVPAEDIIGAFEAVGGAIVAESYQALPTHRLYTEHGPCLPPPTLRAALVRRLPRVG